LFVPVVTEIPFTVFTVSSSRESILASNASSAVVALVTSLPMLVVFAAIACAIVCADCAGVSTTQYFVISSSTVG
jgi:hypothetical protein